MLKCISCGLKHKSKAHVVVEFIYRSTHIYIVTVSFATRGRITYLDDMGIELYQCEDFHKVCRCNKYSITSQDVGRLSQIFLIRVLYVILARSYSSSLDEIRLDYKSCNSGAIIIQCNGLVSVGKQYIDNSIYHYMTCRQLLLLLIRVWVVTNSNVPEQIYILIDKIDHMSIDNFRAVIDLLDRYSRDMN